MREYTMTPKQYARATQFLAMMWAGEVAFGPLVPELFV